MTNKKTPQAAEAAQGKNTQFQNTTESVKSQIDFTELEELVCRSTIHIGQRDKIEG
ncbi:MAG TPA: hypothetical protein IAD19_04085 [Candidatus Egerieicola faecale]|uniref:Uncharacterized protein n=1 Tax=Candidatus Egerieicola faecale TaxID=2840774 RepID=A0A9D1LK96_9FIRM|nr:hypothetical protein [Candidatus Egerieicola faecale]